MPKRGRPKGPEKEPILLRLGSPLLEIIDRLASAELRSRQGQIEKLLQEALTRRRVWPPKVVPGDSAAEDEAPEPAKKESEDGPPHRKFSLGALRRKRDT
jgi:hypothetical protein